MNCSRCNTPYSQGAKFYLRRVAVLPLLARAPLPPANSAELRKLTGAGAPNRACPAGR